MEFFTNALEVPTSGSFICGQAALMSATGLSLDALGVERSKPSPHPASNLLSFTSLNLMLERSSGAGRAFLLRKPFGQSIPATAAFGRKTGMYVLHCYHIPEDDFESGLQLPYGYDVLSCRCTCCHPSPILTLPSQPPPPPPICWLFTACGTHQAGGLVGDGPGLRLVRGASRRLLGRDRNASDPL